MATVVNPNSAVDAPVAGNSAAPRRLFSACISFVGTHKRSLFDGADEEEEDQDEEELDEDPDDKGAVVGNDGDESCSGGAAMELSDEPGKQSSKLHSFLIQ